MIKEYKNLIITVGVILAIVGIYNGYQRYQTEKVATELQTQELAKIQQEKEAKTEEERKKQDLEVAKLKEDLETLKNQKPKTQTIIKEVPAAPQPSSGISLQAVIKQWEPMVAYVECKFSNPNALYQAQGGSGMLYFNPGFSVLTNRHVIFDSTGLYAADSCSIQFPNYDDNRITTILNIDAGRTFITP